MSARGGSELANCDSGATAAEFAILFPVVVIVLLGIISSSLLIYSAASLHYAVEAAARCYSVDSTHCGSTASAQTYASNRYFGQSQPTFTAATAACGHQVNATVTVALDVALMKWSVPLSATACFP